MINKDFLRDHFRKHDTLTLYKLDGAPVTFVKTYEVSMTVSQYEGYNFKDLDRLVAFCKKHHISTHPTITIA